MTIAAVSAIAIYGVATYNGGIESLIYTGVPHGLGVNPSIVIKGALNSSGVPTTLNGLFTASVIDATHLVVLVAYDASWASGGSIWVNGGTVSAATMTGFDSKLATQVTDKTGDTISGAYILANATTAMSVKSGGVLQTNAPGAVVKTTASARFMLGDTLVSSPSPGWTGDDVLLQPTRTRAINVSCTETFCEWYSSYIPSNIVSITSYLIGGTFSAFYVETSTPHGVVPGNTVTITASDASTINNAYPVMALPYNYAVNTAFVSDSTHIVVVVSFTGGPYTSGGTLSTTTSPTIGNPTNRIGAVATGGFFSNIGLPGVYGIAGTGPTPVQSFYLPLTRLHHGASLLSATLYFFPITSLFSTAVPLVPTVFPTFQIYRTNFTGAPVPLASSGPAVFATPKSSAAYQTTPALGSSGSFTLATLNSGPAAISAGRR